MSVRGQWDGSACKSTYLKARQPEFESRPYTVQGENLFPQGVLWPSRVFQDTRVFTYIYRQKCNLTRTWVSVSFKFWGDVLIRSPFPIYKFSVHVFYELEFFVSYRDYVLSRRVRCRHCFPFPGLPFYLWVVILMHKSFLRFYKVQIFSACGFGIITESPL